MILQERKPHLLQDLGPTTNLNDTVLVSSFASREGLPGDILLVRMKIGSFCARSAQGRSRHADLFCTFASCLPEKNAAKE